MKVNRPIAGGNLGARSPSPPPPLLAEIWQQGKNRFTEAEMAYCHAYIRRMIHKNPNITPNEIFDALAAKVIVH